MKTFADLVFHDVEPSNWHLKRAHYKFQNSLGISVVTGPGVSFCTNDTHQYTAAMLDENGEYVRNSDRYFMNDEDVTRMMKEIQEINPAVGGR